MKSQQNRIELVTRTLRHYKCHYIPESLAIVFLGAAVGLFMRLLPNDQVKNRANDLFEFQRCFLSTQNKSHLNCLLFRVDFVV